MKIESALTVFGKDASSFIPVLQKVVRKLGTYRYNFFLEDEFGKILSKDIRKGLQIYWLEILYRAHLSAASSLVRSHRWIDGILLEKEHDNYHAFMGCFRGFLESAADTFDAFQFITAELAQAHTVISQAVVGNLNQMILAPHLEEQLIHFTHAREISKGTTAPESHRAKRTKDYLESLVFTPDKQIAECYHELCEVTHPAAASVMCFLNLEQATSGMKYKFDPNFDRGLILDFCESYSDIMLRVMSLGISPPLATLRLLNEFPVRELHTVGINGSGIETTLVWKEIQEKLAAFGPLNISNSTG
ncbi:MAG: hypothetical protein HY257_04110 [Chloroflexi bacterium]|nr:hypothetical protein [Chloroflexota bacterium]